MSTNRNNQKNGRNSGQNQGYNQNQGWEQQQQQYGGNPYGQPQYQQNPYGNQYGQQQQWQGQYYQQNQYQQPYGGYGQQQYGQQQNHGNQQHGGYDNYNDQNQQNNYRGNQRRGSPGQQNQNSRNNDSQSSGQKQNRKPQKKETKIFKRDPTQSPSAAQARSTEPEPVAKPTIENKTTKKVKSKPKQQPKKEPKKETPQANAWDDDDSDEPAPAAQPVEEPKKEKAKPVAEEPEPTEVVTPEQEEIKEEAKPAAKPKPEIKKESKKKKDKKKKKVKAHDSREHLNIVFIGHVDAGKSTLSGQILLQTGQVDSRTIQKYEREAKEKNRESWWIAYIMDTSEEERAKGKTVECGRAHFDTEKKRYTILDAPGHKNYVPHMISGAAQADVACLVISARSGEFEAGFNRGGQTREHTRLAFTLGIKRMVIILNKMDCVDWSVERRDEILIGVESFVKSVGYQWKNVTVIPVSGQQGLNVSSRLEEGVCSWYDGPCLLECLDNLKKIKRQKKKALRIPVMDRYKDMGCIMCIGKIEANKLTVGEKIMVMPAQKIGTVVKLNVDEDEVQMAGTGENVVVGLKGISDDDVHGGDILCDLSDFCPRVTYIECQIELLELLEHKPLFSIGYSAIFHCHNLSVECECVEIPHKVHRKTGRKSREPPRFLRSKEAAIIRLRLSTPLSLIHI